MLDLLLSQASYTHDMLQASQVDPDTDAYDLPDDYEVDVAVTKIVTRAKWFGAYSIAVDSEAVGLAHAYPGWRHSELRNRLAGCALNHGLSIQAG